MCQKIYFEINVLQIRFTLGLLWWLRWYRICLQCRRPGFDPWVGKTPWKREWVAILVFLPGEFHGQRCLVVYSPQVYSQTGLSDFHFTYFPYSEAESQGPSCWVTFQCVHLIVFRVSVTSHVRGHVTVQDVWIWGVAFAFSSSLFWIMFLLLCFVAQLVKNPPAMRETWVWFLGWEDTLEKEKATHSSILTWRIPWIV